MNKVLIVFGFVLAVLVDLCFLCLASIVGNHGAQLLFISTWLVYTGTVVLYVVNKYFNRS